MLRPQRLRLRWQVALLNPGIGHRSASKNPELLRKCSSKPGTCRAMSLALRKEILNSSPMNMPPRKSPCLSSIRWVICMGLIGTNSSFVSCTRWKECPQGRFAMNKSIPPTIAAVTAHLPEGAPISDPRQLPGHPSCGSFQQWCFFLPQKAR